MRPCPLVSENDARHEMCLSALAPLATPLVTCWPVLTEAAWLLRRRPAALQKVFEAIERNLFAVLSLGPEAVEPISQILKRYESMRPQLADAALVYLADREGIARLFTLDRRDFAVYRLKRNRALELLPRGR